MALKITRKYCTLGECIGPERARQLNWRTYSGNATCYFGRVCDCYSEWPWPWQWSEQWLPLQVSRTATALWPWPWMALMAHYPDLDQTPSTASPITNGKYTLRAFSVNCYWHCGLCLDYCNLKAYNLILDMSLATILLLYLADRDAMASAKSYTCSAWRKEPAIGVWKGNPWGSFPPFQLIGNGSHIQG